MKYLIANWKMQLDVPASVKLARVFATKKLSGCTGIVCPSAPALVPVAQALRGSMWKLGAQDYAVESGGAVTGGVSAAAVRSAGARWAILGHSERRSRGETDAQLGEKLQRAAEQHLGVIFCVGETKAKLSDKQRFAFMQKQLQILAGYQGKIIIAYEPVWAIGTGVSCVPDRAAHVIAIIREWCGAAQLPKTPVLYGGSVDGSTITSYLQHPAIDGCLIGGASSSVVGVQAIFAACTSKKKHRGFGVA